MVKKAASPCCLFPREVALPVGTPTTRSNTSGPLDFCSSANIRLEGLFVQLAWSPLAHPQKPITWTNVEGHWFLMRCLKKLGIPAGGRSRLWSVSFDAESSGGRLVNVLGFFRWSFKPLKDLFPGSSLVGCVIENLADLAQGVSESELTPLEHSYKAIWLDKVLSANGGFFIFFFLLIL